MDVRFCPVLDIPELYIRMAFAECSRAEYAKGIEINAKTTPAPAIPQAGSPPASNCPMG
jgi:hypothetical protein